MTEPQRVEMPQTEQVIALMCDMRDQILREMNLGFKGSHHRQDVTNGRILKLEEDRARHDERIETLAEERHRHDQRLEALEADRDAFHQHRRVTDPAPAVATPASEESGDDRRITQRDVRVVLLGFAAAVGLFKILPWLIALGQAAKP